MVTMLLLLFFFFFFFFDDDLFFCRIKTSCRACAPRDRERETERERDRERERSREGGVRRERWMCDDMDDDSIKRPLFLIKF